MGQGDQSNESALEQAKDEQISGERARPQYPRGFCAVLTMAFYSVRLHPRPVQEHDRQGRSHCRQINNSTPMDNSSSDHAYMPVTY